MEFTIVPALWRFAQLTNMNSKTTAIDQDMEWRFLLVFVERDVAQLRLASRDRCVIGDIIVQIQQSKQRTDKPLGLPGRQTKHHAQSDSRLNCVIRVLALTAWFPFLRPWRIPVRKLAIVE
jgi:hypothetical protein